MTNLPSVILHYYPNPNLYTVRKIDVLNCSDVIKMTRIH